MQKSTEKPVAITFPIKGINVATSFSQQPPESTPRGVNVRAFEAQYGRGRGGVRAGLSKWIPPAVPAGSHLIQHLNIVVDPQSPALLGDVSPTEVDPGTHNLRQRYPTVPGSRRMYRRRGSAVRPRLVPSARTPGTLLQKKGAFSVADGSSSVSFDFDNVVEVGSLVIVVVTSAVQNSARGPSHSLTASQGFSPPTNGAGLAYAQVGGITEQTNRPDLIAPGVFYEYGQIAVYYKTASAGSPDRTVTVNYETPDAFGGQSVAVAAFEYYGIGGGPLSPVHASGTSDDHISPGEVTLSDVPGQFVFGAFMAVANPYGVTPALPTTLQNGFVSREGYYVKGLGADFGTGQLIDRPNQTAVSSEPLAVASCECNFCAIGCAFNPI